MPALAEHPAPHAAQREWAHAQALRSRGNALPPGGRPDAAILDSWVRCMQAGLDPHAVHPVPVVEAGDLARRREQSAVARRLAQAELETLAQQIAGSNFLLAFADREGVILDLYADNRFLTSGQGDAGIVAGSCWSEALAGTNGLGTALALGRAVAVTGLEHYFLDLGAVSCTAAPVHDPEGQVVGVLDASSFFESRQHHTQALVQMAATHIENGLLLHQLRSHWVLALHPRPEFLGTLSAGLLAFDESGRLKALNARARHLLQGLDARPGGSFEALFGEPFEQVMARLVRQPEVRLRDLLGSSLMAACVNRPRMPRLEATLAPLPRVRVPEAIPEAIPEAVTDDPTVAEAYALAARASRLGVPILIRGETGTGKELLARHVHASSGRRGAFVAVNCGAVPAELFEAELFGYAGGAFTGARREGSVGLIASADGGTLLLDEIGELPLPLQAALLRFLDDQQVRPVGATRQRRMDVQLLAATHADLDAEVAAGRFRADLLYRLDTVRVALPNLASRRDFALCVQRLLAALEPTARLDDAALALLQRQRWAGNFRELRAVLTRALLAGSDGRIGAEALAQGLRREPGRVEARDSGLVGATAGATVGATASGTASSALRQSADDLVRRELERQGGSISGAARALGVSRTTVYRHLRGG